MGKTGWLVVNGFLGGAKYSELYAYLLTAARKQSINLVLMRNDDLVGTMPALPDFVLFWDKDVALARRLERAGVPVFNSARAIEICDNKILTAEALEGKVATPKTVIAPKTFEGVGYTDLEFLKKVGGMLSYPMVIKEAYGSFGKQVYLAENYKKAVCVVGKIGHKDFLMQEFIARSSGKDIRVNVVGGKVVAAMLRCNDGDFRSNITGGGKAQSITLTAAQEKTAIAACEAVGADFAGVDILLGEIPLVCEVNSNPHFKSTYECTGVDMSEYILRHIAERL